MSYLHNGEREGIKDGDGSLTFQRKDGPPWQSSDLYLMDLKESLIIFSCIILMPYADLRTRERDGDRGLAIQRREHMRQMMGVVVWPPQRGTGYHIHHCNHAQNLFHAHAHVWFKSPKFPVLSMVG